MRTHPRSLRAGHLVPALVATLCTAAAGQSWDQALPIEDVETGLSCGVAATATAAAVGTPRFDPYNQAAIQDDVRVYELQAGAWVQVALLTSAEPTPTSASYGRALALEGDLLAVGDPAAPGPGSITGAVHLYRRGPTGWELEQVLRPETLGLSALEFGTALDLDAGRLAVGAPTSTVASGGLEDGSVYLFEPSPTGFVEAQRLDSPGGSLFTHFGRGLDLDGELLAVGEPGGGSTGVDGAVHLFDGSSGSFVPLAVVEPSLPDPSGGFGTSVALSGAALAVGSPGVNLGNFGDGRVTVFEGSGSAWTETATLEHVTGRPYERFGSDLAFDEQGSLYATSQSTASTLRFDPTPSGWTQAESYITAAGLVWPPPMSVRMAPAGGRLVQSDPQGATVFPRAVAAELEQGCPGDPHPLSATGRAVLLDAQGLLSLSEPTLSMLAVTDAAVGPGVLFYGFGPAAKPFSGTTLCVQAPLARAVSAPAPSASSFVALDVDLQSKPVSGGAKAILPGVEAHFQYWFRVPTLGTTFLSSSLRTVFAP